MFVIKLAEENKIVIIYSATKETVHTKNCCIFFAMAEKSPE